MITVELPFPPRQLMPNCRMDRRAKASYAQTARGTAKYETYNARPNWDFEFPPEQRIPLSLTYYPPDYKARDLDNLLAASKALIDGMCDALNINDKMFCPIVLDWGRVEKGGKVIVQIG